MALACYLPSIKNRFRRAPCSGISRDTSLETRIIREHGFLNIVRNLLSVIRKGDWKLLLFLEEWSLDGGRKKLSINHAVELYNLAKDIGETQDLALIHTEKRDELLADLLTWHREIKAEIPKDPNPLLGIKKEKKTRGNKTKSKKK